jgi:hypothetical protein
VSSSTGPLWSVGSTIHGRMLPVHACPRGSRAPPRPFDFCGLPPAGCATGPAHPRSGRTPFIRPFLSSLSFPGK